MRQLELNPSHLVGAEDLHRRRVAGAKLGANVHRSMAQTIRRLNNDVATLATRDQAALSPVGQTRYYPVASALSYNTAVDAGRAFAQRGHTRAAMGFGAYMADDHYSDYLVIGRRTTVLPNLMPNRYLRTVVVARGFWDGYSAEAAHPPEGFHFLGLGAPILMALVSLCAWGTQEVTFDAMSPIKDAVEGTLYTSKPAYLKLRTRSIAYRLATSPGGVWDCPCPICEHFVAGHAFRYDVGRAWHARTGAKEVTAADLRPGGPLFEVTPCSASRLEARFDAKCPRPEWATITGS